MEFSLRKATTADVPVLEKLICESVRILQKDEYTEAQREGALATVYGVDTQLIADGTYFVVENDAQIVGCGGWSKRKTLFGGDHYTSREDNYLDPHTDAAKIRAFFIQPGFTRRGIGTQILNHCEQEAIAQGFRRLEMGATLTGVALYKARGYVEIEPISVSLPGDETLAIIKMGKAVT